MTAREWRWSPQYRRARKAVLAGETFCWLCGGSNFVDIPRHPLSRSVDHVLALRNGGHPWARSNLRLAHYSCNSARGKGDRQSAPAPLPPRSEAW